MANIVLARIDDRLIHGQIMAKWSKKLFFKRIYIVDDSTVKDMFACRLMKSIAPKNIELIIASVDDAAKQLVECQDEVETCILTKVPESFERLIDAGVELKEVQLGGMGSNSKRKSLVRNTAASVEERECMRRMIDRGINVYYQDIPETKIVDLKNLL